MKIRDAGSRWLFHCPGCNYAHQFVKSGPWTFNGDLDKPTFYPSLLIAAADSGRFQCHSFVTDGKINFLSDSTHPLSGQTVSLPEWKT